MVFFVWFCFGFGFVTWSILFDFVTCFNSIYDYKHLISKNITVKLTDIENLKYPFNIMAEVSTTPNGDPQIQT
jgi:hypothetical protein